MTSLKEFAIRPTTTQQATSGLKIYTTSRDPKAWKPLTVTNTKVTPTQPVIAKPKLVSPPIKTQIATPPSITHKLIQGGLDFIHKVGSKDFTKETKQFSEKFPQTTQNIKAIASDPYNLRGNYKKAIPSATKVIKDAWTESYKRSIRAKQPTKSVKEKVVREAEAVVGAVNAIFSLVAAPFEAAGNLPGPVGTASKLLSIPFSAIDEGAPQVSNKLVDNLPISKETKERIRPVVAEVFTLAGQIALGKAIDIGGKKAKVTIEKVGVENFEKLTKNIIEETKSGTTVNITPSEVRSANLGKSGYEADLVKSLGLSSSEWRDAIKNGISIEIPAEKIVRIIDKPYWEKVKSIFKIKPTDRTITTGGKPVIKSNFGGYLTDGEYTPQEVIGKVITNNIENTTEGRALIKQAVDAQKNGTSVVIKSQADLAGKESPITSPTLRTSISEPSLGEAGRVEPSGSTILTDRLSPEKSTNQTVSSKRISFLREFDIHQPSDSDYTKYFKNIQAQEGNIKNTLIGLSKEANTNYYYRQKTKESISRKLQQKPLRVLSKINDAWGGAVIVKENEIPKMIKIAEKKGIKVSSNFRDKPTFLGYRGIHLDYELPNGQQAEIQYHTYEGAVQKEYAHLIYEKWRKYIEKNASATFDEVLGLIPKNQWEEFKKDVDFSNRIYEGKEKIPQKYYDFINNQLRIKGDTKTTIEEYSRLVKEGSSELEEQISKNESITSQLAGFSGETLKKIATLKRMAASKEGQEGDIETLYKKSPQITADVIEAVIEQQGKNMTDQEAVDYALSLPSKSEISVKANEKIKQANKLLSDAGIKVTEDYSQKQSLEEFEKQFTEANADLGGVEGRTGMTKAAAEKLYKSIDRLRTIENKLSLLQPLGEGKEKVSRLEARMQKVLGDTSQETIERLGLATFNELNKKENIAKAAEYVINNPEAALQVLKGEIESPPGILRNSIYVAMQNMAVGDVALARKLASISSTRMGQEISILTEIDPNSPVQLMKEIVRIKEEGFKKKYGNKTVKEVTSRVAKTIREKIKAPDKYDWNNFINSIETC